MKLFINKTPFTVTRLPLCATRVKKFLDASHDGELFKSHTLAMALNIESNYLRQANHYLPSYWHKVKHVLYWGKPATIKQLRKETK